MRSFHPTSLLRRLAHCSCENILSVHRLTCRANTRVSLGKPSRVGWPEFWVHSHV
jgi:hypothetical protein